MSTDTTLQSLVGPGPPPHLSKMSLMRWAVKNPPMDPTHPLNGRTVIVTGSNTGVGYHAALKFVALGANIILAVRTLSKGAEAKSRILAATGRDETSITVLHLDMASFASVREFASCVDAQVETLDVVVLNAGIMPPEYVVCEETDWEAALQVNILSTALLAILLMPKMKRTAAVTGRLPQMTLTGSAVHKSVAAERFVTRPGESLLRKIGSHEMFNLKMSYDDIKLLTMYVMQGLVSDYATNEEGNVEVAVNVVCPGLCATDLGRDFPWYLALPMKAMYMYYARTAEEGSRSLVSATLLGRAGHGKFWTNDMLDEPGPLVTSERGKGYQAQVWKEILDVCNKEMD